MCLYVYVCICKYIHGRRGVRGAAACMQTEARAQADRILYHICIDFYVFICICMYMYLHVWKTRSARRGVHIDRGSCTG